MQVDDMQEPLVTHLDPERIAAFDDEPFTPDEQAHLAVCAACRAEHEAVRAVVAMALELRHAEHAPTAPRLVEWDAIARGLRAPAEATVAHVPAPLPGSRRTMAPLMRRAAAALLLVGGGAVFGRLSGEVSAARANGGTVADASLTAAGLAVRPVSNGTDNDFTDIDDATRVLNRAQRDYERASLWLAANDTTMRDSDVYRARLAALDQMMAASRAALRDAPQDPVLNHYYLAAYTAREATLQQLGGTLPVDKVIERY